MFLIFTLNAMADLIDKLDICCVVFVQGIAEVLY